MKNGGILCIEILWCIICNGSLFSCDVLYLFLFIVNVVVVKVYFKIEFFKVDILFYEM